MFRAMMMLNAVLCCDARKLDEFESLGLDGESFVKEGEKLWERLGISERSRGNLSKLAASNWAEREIERCDKLGVCFVTCRDESYPAGLWDLPDPPIGLYCRGHLPRAFSRSLAVVGTRRCSGYGERVSADIGRMAAALGWSVVSGGAKGIDAASHKGCLERGGATVAVLGTGLDTAYPAEHASLFEEICVKGALVSEYRLGAKGEAWRFPRRNRIIAAAAARAVVVEAPARSGAMITSRLAAEIGREVWAVPGRIGDERCEGSNRVIFDGAIPLVDLELFFGTAYSQARLFDDSEPAALNVEDVSLDYDERTIISLLRGQGDRTVDILACEAKMSAAEVFKKLSLMSLRGLVRSSGPGRYRLCDD